LVRGRENLDHSYQGQVGQPLDLDPPLGNLVADSLLDQGGVLARKRRIEKITVVREQARVKILPEPLAFQKWVHSGQGAGHGRKSSHGRASLREFILPCGFKSEPEERPPERPRS